MKQLQGGLTNEQLRAEWDKKLPGMPPIGHDLSAFALGVEVGCVRCVFLERERDEAQRTFVPPSPTRSRTSKKTETTRRQCICSELLPEQPKDQHHEENSLCARPRGELYRGGAGREPARSDERDRYGRHLMHRHPRRSVQRRLQYGDDERQRRSCASNHNHHEDGK